MRKNISSTIRMFVSRVLVAVVIIQNFAFAVPMTEAAQQNPQAGMAVHPMISAGYWFTTALKSDGTVWSWGQNASGQLGNGDITLTDSNLPVQVHGAGDVGFLTGVKSIAAGAQHATALKSDGTVWAWGYNGSGGLGDNTYTDSTYPVQVSGLSGVSSIDADGYVSIALKTDGTVWAWGANYYGQLGDNNAESTLGAPQQIPGFTNVKEVMLADRHAIALKSDGTVWTWGYNSSGQLGDGTYVDSGIPIQVPGLSNMKAVAGGYTSSIALKADGAVWAWGKNTSGQLGDGTIADNPSPVQVSGLTGVVSIAAGGNANRALKSDGTVWSWGRNSGTLANNSYTNSNVPVQATGFTRGVAVSNGAYFATAMKADGTVWSSGENGYGQQGDGVTGANTLTMTKATINLYVGNAGVIAIAGGNNHSLALKANGTVWAWGDNAYGQLGNASYTDSDTPVGVSGLATATAIAAGSDHSLALLTDGTVWAWGYNLVGQLGNGSNSNSNVPVAVSGLSGVVAIAAGGFGHSLALKADGTVWAWGYNAYGQLGNANYGVDSNIPVQVSGLTNVTSIAAEGDHSLALKAGGTAWAWGYNLQGQLGDGTNTDSDVPVAVTVISNVVMIASGGYNSLSKLADGTVWAWGDNTFGQLGDGTNTSTNAPGVITGFTNVIALAGGNAHSVALKTDGTVWTWGYNLQGQLGNGGNIDTNVPGQVSGVSDVTAVAAGFFHTLARKSDGTLLAWGSNSQGQLGNGTLADSNVPVVVIFSAAPVTLNTTNNVVVLSRISVNVQSEATIYFTLNDTISSQLTLTFDPAFSGIDVSGATASTPSSPGCMTNFSAVGGNGLIADKSNCTGAVIISGVLITNPGTPGPYLVSWVNDDEGYAMVAIVDSDQVTVNATIDPTITFDLDAGIAAGETPAPYNVALGALTIGAVNHSDHSGINSIFAQLATNATSGAIVTVSSFNGSLYSDSSGDYILNSAGTMAAGTANYGICVSTATPPSASTGSLNPAAPYNAGTCSHASSTNDVKLLSYTPTTDPILTSAGAPLTGGQAEIIVNAAIDTSTPAHSDYNDILTFVATGTF